MILKILPAKVILFGLLLAGAIGLIFYLIIFKGEKTTITSLTFKRQQLMVRAETSNFVSFFEGKDLPSKELLR